jgi:16S rRNA processing protein RimM
LDAAGEKPAFDKPASDKPASDKPASDKRVLLGKIVGLFGVDGWVKVESYTEPRAQIFKYGPWFVTRPGGEVEIAGAQGRTQGKGLIATLPDVGDREAAAALIGAEIWVRRSALPRSRRGEYYWVDLEGADVVTTQGMPLGKVSHMFATGANDVMVVRDGERERMIPFVLKQFVLEVDLNAGRITVDWDPDF